MIPIHELLSRIRWDKDYAKGEFEIGYYDRVEDRVVRVPLSAADFEADDHYSFRLMDAEGEVHLIPLHRVKAVYKDGELIWERHH